jgi:hypothetical protein
MNDLTAILHDIQREHALRCGLPGLPRCSSASPVTSGVPKPRRRLEPNSELAAIPDGAVRDGSPVYGGGG